MTEKRQILNSRSLGPPVISCTYEATLKVGSFLPRGSKYKRSSALGNRRGPSVCVTPFTGSGRPGIKLSECCTQRTKEPGVYAFTLRMLTVSHSTALATLSFRGVSSVLFSLMANACPRR